MLVEQAPYTLTRPTRTPPINPTKTESSCPRACQSPQSGVLDWSRSAPRSLVPLEGVPPSRLFAPMPGVSGEPLTAVAPTPPPALPPSLALRPDTSCTWGQ